MKHRGEIYLFRLCRGLGTKRLRLKLQPQRAVCRIKPCFIRHLDYGRGKIAELLCQHFTPVHAVDRCGGLLIDDALLRWPDAFSFSPDDWCYAEDNQLHLRPILNAGEDATEPHYLIVRYEDDAGGVVGR